MSSYANFTFKDSRGIIWIGTQYGLYRFDGQGFKHYDEQFGLPFRQVMEIYEDADGWFWLFRSCLRKPNCEKDLAFFHPLREEVQTFEERFGDKTSIQANQIEGIVEDSGNIYFTAEHQFFIWSSKNGIKGIQIKGLPVTPKIWTKIDENLFGAYYYENPSLGYTQLFTSNIFYVAIDANGNVKQAPQRMPVQGLSLDKIKLKAFQFKRLRVGNFEISFSPNGALKTRILPFELPCRPSQLEYYHFDEQLGTQEDGKVFHPTMQISKDLASVYRPKLELPVRISGTVQTAWVQKKDDISNNFQQIHIGEKYRNLYFDNTTKTAWMSGAEGIQTIRFESKYFSSLLNPLKDQQLATNVIPLTHQKAILGIGTDLFLYSPNEPLKSIPTTIPKDAFTSFFRAVAEDSNEVWAMGRHHLLKINPSDVSISEIEVPIQNLVRPRSMVKFDKECWIGDLTGIQVYDIEQNNFKPFSRYNEYPELESGNIHFFKKIDDSHLWIGTNSGLYFASYSKGILNKYGNTEENEYFLPALNFFHLSEAKAGGYWLATMNGLIWWNPEIENSQTAANKSKHYNQFPTKEILAAYEDDYGFVWMPTPHGLIQFQINTQLSKIYTRADGLTSTGFQEYAHGRDADGTLFMGSYQGFNVFDPKDFKGVKSNPDKPLIILDFEQYNSKTEKVENRLEQLIKEEIITLNPGEKFFNIRVMHSDYNAVEQQRLTYQIEGYTEAWQQTESNLIQIIGLPYGKYVLKIKETTSEADSGNSFLAIPIQVLRPFYLQGWFFILSGLSLILIAYLFYRKRTQNLINRQKLLEKAIAEATETINQKNISLAQQAEDLRQLDKLKSRFFANISHEFRTPLTLIIEPLRQLISNPNKENWQSKIMLAERNSQKLLELVNQLLDLAKLEDKRMSLDLRRGDILETIRPIYQSFLSLAEKKEIHLKFDVNKKLEPIYFDKDKVEKVVYNLMSNAVKFTETGSVQLVIDSATSELSQKLPTSHALIITVKDTGRGIPSKALPKIFDRFYQVDASTIREGEGTGIGLALTKELVELMGGVINIESEIGKGSTFTVQLPMLKQLPNQQATFNPEQSNKPLEAVPVQTSQEELSFLPQEIENQPSPKQLLLLIEDNPEMRQFIKRSLPDTAQIVEASNGEEGIQKAMELIPDLIISDLMMPKKDGFEVTDYLKNEEKTSHIPIILLTAKAAIESKLKGLKRGADAYLTKPFHTEELIVRVEKLIESRKLLQEKFSQQTKAHSKKPIQLFSKIDNDFLRKFTLQVEAFLDDETLSVELLAQHMNLSRSQLYRKIKALTGQSPNDFVRNYRLDRAMELLKNKEGNVMQVSVMVGFGDEKYFSTRFKARFGSSPSEV